MKKNRLMRLACLLIVLTLMTSCFVGGTFAKYTTSATIGGAANGADGSSARVAKFGVAIEANTDGAGTDAVSLFKKEYKNGQTVTVQSDDFVVAPGTKNGADAGSQAAVFGLKMTGTPEVRVAVKYEGTVSLGSTGANDNGAWEVDGAYYCPLIFKIGGKTFNGTAYNSLYEFQEALSAAVNYETTVAPGTDLSALANNGVALGDLAIEWEWPFEVDNAKDTALGNAAAATTGGASAFEMSFAVTASVEQVQ